MDLFSFSLGSKKNLSLAFQDLMEIPPKVIKQSGKECRELDLTGNAISDLSGLSTFAELRVLVADGNRISEHTKFPKLENLATLWVNRNRITNLVTFIDKLALCTPNIRHLSMLNNDACPNYFNGGTSKQYSDYRIYVVSRLGNLTTLDDRAVTPEERETALKQVEAPHATLPAKEEKRKQPGEKKKESKKKENQTKRKGAARPKKFEQKKIEEEKEQKDRKEEEEEKKAKNLKEDVLKNELPPVDTTLVFPEAAMDNVDKDDEDDSDDSEESD